MRFHDKVAIVTGASRGIGLATARAFAREGARVAIIDRDETEGQAVAQNIQQELGTADIMMVPADISDEAQVQALVQAVISRWNRVDVLVNNAGIYHQANVIDTTLEAWNNLMAVNLTGAFLCTKYVAATMKQSGGGVIINIASEAGLVGIKGQVAYNVSKAGMISLTQSCAVDLAPDAIRVNCVCPGTTETPLVKAAVNRAADPGAARRVLEVARPLNRLGRPEEIASAILYLASEEAGYATGAILSIDGGYTAQ